MSESDSEKGVLVDLERWRTPLKASEEFPFTARENPGEVFPILTHSLFEWVREARARKRRGNSLHSADEPAELLLGFVDEKDRLRFLLPLHKLRDCSAEELDLLDLTMEDLETPSARALCLGFSSLF